MISECRLGSHQPKSLVPQHPTPLTFLPSSRPPSDLIVIPHARHHYAARREYSQLRRHRHRRRFVSSSDPFDGQLTTLLSLGLTGIVAAQRLLQAHPETRLAILERDYCVGGVWSERTCFATSRFPLLSSDFVQDGFIPAFGRNGRMALQSSPICLWNGHRPRIA